MLLLAFFILRLVFLFDFIGGVLRGGVDGVIDGVIDWSKEVVLGSFKLHHREVKKFLTLTSSLIRNNG